MLNATLMIHQIERVEQILHVHDTFECLELRLHGAEDTVSISVFGVDQPPALIPLKQVDHQTRSVE